ncbi:fam-a protein [Plasmodium chabaudi chabaudi]|uniref:Fam-a protein n=1 Tax=Plasmodium chabaudi chabaudi TaxID=31271 RepID=A0A4V6M9X6_PLACU|nr:fam-a protein [Plasmodium chabaudi chabaudi]VTZ70700.1 fam-a protein [Plasmodium chabaudi chabaudi]|eukprot:XP_016654801.1 fam-a protein [Plasmodium chabaudi chabaudi]
MNKFYIQIVLFFLSVSVYLNNKILATELVPRTFTKTKSKKRYDTSQEIYEKNNHLLCTDPEELINAEKYMKEAVEHFKYHAMYLNGYQPIERNPNSSVFYFKKKHEGHIVEKIERRVHHPDKYNEVVNMSWNFDHATFPNARSVKRKIARVYNPNLVVMQQRYRRWRLGRQKYFYALASKITENTNLIVMVSADINDHHPSKKKYENKIIKNTNVFKIDIDSEDDIRKGKLQKTFVNIAGYLIQKYDQYVDITFVASIDGHSCI